MIKSKSDGNGLVAILSANVIFGLNIPVTKALVANWMSPLAYTTTRMVFGAVVFWCIGLFFKKEKVKSKDMIIMFIGGLMGYLGTQFLFSQSLKYTSPVVFSLLMALTPVVVLLLSSVFLKESIPLRKVAGIVLSVSGAVLIVFLGSTGGVSGANNSLGIIYALMCVLGYSGYMVLTRTLSVKYSPVTVAKYMFLVSAIIITPLTFNTLNNQRIFSDEISILAVSLLGFALLFSTTLAFFLMPYALKRLEASTVSIFMNVQPIVASVIAIIVGQDVLTWDKPLAVVMVVTGVYLVTVQPAKSTNRKITAYILNKRKQAD